MRLDKKTTTTTTFTTTDNNKNIENDPINISLGKKRAKRLKTCFRLIACKTLSHQALV